MSHTGNSMVKNIKTIVPHRDIRRHVSIIPHQRSRNGEQIQEGIAL